MERRETFPSAAFLWGGMASRTRRTPKRRQVILDVLRAGNSVGFACEKAGIGRQTYYDWRHDDPTFMANTEDAIEAGTDILEDVAKDRAVRHSDTLLIFLLKSRRPDKYRDSTRHDGKIIHDHTGNVTHTLRDLRMFTDAEIDSMAAIAERVKAGSASEW